ncbi:DUF4397 domain-containing protein [Paramaledivibacter caminithermalis]|jgi:hypothetical protein|uniref:DUF4397 domain-containing protein n=1 Tax=Paramaledivibacter caminithermalis (strain DSM 15212 / CIP 107654 / DViRD3) TaxID=1121301 RepID=A0A1M6RB88_PARC5|nr:DUF4397 domain-containing protein [Paramaledivibacter caminithermalis]SHK29721.1 protein of unknown function [Paramaledivibacter caminithermalis DSM 15212]
MIPYYPYMPMGLPRSCRRTTENSYVRLFHASPNAPAVDVYADGKPIAENFSYGKLSRYLPVVPGNYNIKIYPTGSTTNPVLDTDLYIPQRSIFNAAVIGELPNISLYPIPEPYYAQKFGRPCIRFIHLSPNAPAVDIILSDGSKIFSNIGYKDITDYVCVPAGTYTFEVRPTGSDDVVLTIPDVRLKSNSYYTIYAAGLVGEIPALDAILAPEPRR